MEVAANNVVAGPWEDPSLQGQPYVDPSEGALPLTDKKDMFREAEEALQLARELAFRDQDFHDNFDDNHWTDQEKALLTERGQPLYTHNRCKKKINTLKGMEQRSRTDPKAYPRKPQMEQMAQVATDILNAIDDKTKFDAKASIMFGDLTVPGVEAVEVVWDDEEQKISADKVRYDEHFYDPYSSELNFEDATYQGYAKWWNLDTAQGMYPDKTDSLTAAFSTSQASTEYEDRPTSMWISRSGKRQRVRIIVMYYKTAAGQWRLTHFAGNTDLLDIPSPWVDDKGKPVCGIEAQACYKDRENRCYGVLRDMIGPQKELNHYRAKMWHYANNRRTWGNDGAFKDVTEAKREMAKVDGHVMVNPGMKNGEDWGFIESAEDVNIFGMLLGQAESEIGVQSPNEALVGRQASSQSGRAGEVQRDAGMTEEHDVFDLHRQFKERVYTKMFWLARQFWTQPDFIRVTDEDDAMQFIELNQPQMNEFGQFMGVKNNVMEMDCDIVVKSMPEVAVLQQEQFETLAKLADRGMPIPPVALIKASQIKDKDEILKTLQEPDPAQQMGQQLEMAGKEAQVKEMQAQAIERQAKTQKMQAETQRIQAEVPMRMQELDHETRLRAAEIMARQQPQIPVR